MGADNHPTVVPTNHEERNEQNDLSDGTDLQFRGQIVFDEPTDDAFEDLVEQTLEESEFIHVENGIIFEVMDE